MRCSLNLSPDGFLLSTQCGFSPPRSGGLFIEIVRHAVRSGLSLWMRKTCFQATMTASMTTGCNPANNRFLFSFFYGSLSLIYKNNQIKKRDFLLFICMNGFQIMRASSPICSPSMQICFLPKKGKSLNKKFSKEKKKPSSFESLCNKDIIHPF